MRTGELNSPFAKATHGAPAMAADLRTPAIASAQKLLQFALQLFFCRCAL